MYPALKRTEQETTTNQDILNRLKNKSQNWYEVYHQGYRLPCVEPPHSWCGSWSWLGCLNLDGHVRTPAENQAFIKTFQRHCFRASCEDCAKNWISRESNKSASRIGIYEQKTGEQSKHIIVSPPHYLKNKPISELRKLAYKVLKNVNAKGGCMVVHPFRKYEQTTFSYSSKWVWYQSIHFHVVGFGWIDNVAENYKKNGWIVKNIGIRKSNFGTIRYILSHAGIKKGSHTLTWFGDLSYSKLKVPDYVNEERLCPYCSESLTLVLPRDTTTGEPPPEPLECLVSGDAWFIPYYAQNEYSKNI